MFSQVFKNCEVYFDSDIPAFLSCFFLVHFSISMTNKEVLNVICLVGDLLELKSRWKI